MPKFLSLASALCILSMLCCTLPMFGQGNKKRVIISDPVVEGEATLILKKSVLDGLQEAISKQKKYRAVLWTSSNFDSTLSKAKTEQVSGLINVATWEDGMDKINSGDYLCRISITTDSSAFIVSYTLTEASGELVKSVSKDLLAKSGNVNDLQKACENLAKTLFK